ncbi:MAG: exopolysaccharide Pel transporter PelG [Angelakisella sp.]
MAGIGFELRKVFNKKSVFSKVGGLVFATMTTIGPTIIFMLMLIGVNFVLQQFEESSAVQLFFSSACLYVFLICILISGLMGTILSRFISDRIHEEKEEYIPSCLWGSTILVTVLTAFFVGIICLCLYVRGDADLRFLLGLYLLAILVSVTYNSMVFVSSLKEYGKVSLAFLWGIIVGIICFSLLYGVMKVEVIHALLASMVAVFFTISLIIFYLILTFFPHSNSHWFAFLGYFKKHQFLVLSGFFYILGLYIPNIVYWIFSEISVTVSIFRVAPSYDMAMFLAVVVNLTAPVIFVVNVETKFYEKYRSYTGHLLSGTYEAIEKHRKIMFRTIDAEMFYIYETQLIITIVLSCVGILVLPMLGFGGIVMNFFLILAIGIYAVYLMYFTVVFLYYFDDQAGSCLTTATFLVTTTIASLVAARMGVSFYPVALLVGGVVSWFVAFFRLKYFLKNINARLFCREAQ